MKQARSGNSRGNLEGCGTPATGTVAPRLLPIEQLRTIVNTFTATHGGIEHMNLDAWRDLEQELNRRYENERPERHY